MADFFCNSYVNLLYKPKDNDTNAPLLVRCLMAIQKMATDGPLDGAIDGPAGNYAISLFGTQSPQDGRCDKALENLGEISRQHTGRFTRVVLTLSRVNTNAHSQYIHWTLSVNLGRSEEVSQWSEMHI